MTLDRKLQPYADNYNRYLYQRALPTPDFEQARQALLGSVSGYIQEAKKDEYLTSQRLRFLTVAVTAGVLSESLQNQDSLIYFLLDDVAARVKHLCNGRLEYILDESKKYHAQSALKEIDKIKKRGNRKRTIGKSKATILIFVTHALNGIEIEKGGTTYKLHPKPFRLFYSRHDPLNERMKYYYVVPI